MTGPTALKAAYAVTWIIALGYVRYVLVRFRQVHKEIKDLKRSA